MITKDQALEIKSLCEKENIPCRVLFSDQMSIPYKNGTAVLWVDGQQYNAHCTTTRKAYDRINTCLKFRGNK